MPTRKRNAREPAREHRIENEIIVDAYGQEEQAMGWYYYLDEVLHVPFPARCRTARAISPLSIGERVTVTGMAPESECEHEMFVLIRWHDRALAVPLAQLEVRGMRGVDAKTREAVADWHYWLDQGYTF
ncbi:MAG TPA: calcium-binding protein [Gemmatimonadaceae bacterium]|nr:calcium-binding protein [Gemmatimonadaceae bacterium]